MAFNVIELDYKEDKMIFNFVDYAKNGPFLKIDYFSSN